MKSERGSSRYLHVAMVVCMTAILGCSMGSTDKAKQAEAQRAAIERNRQKALTGDKRAEKELRETLGTMGRTLCTDLLMHAIENNQRLPRTLNELHAPVGSGLEREMFEFVAGGKRLDPGETPGNTPMLILKGSFPWRLVFTVEGTAWFLDLNNEDAMQRYEEMRQLALGEAEAPRPMAHGRAPEPAVGRDMIHEAERVVPATREGVIPVMPD